MEKVTHKTLACGIELACAEIPDRRIAAIEFRLCSGIADEPPALLGLAHVVQETIDLGTAHYDGRGLSDAFDAIGASHTGWTARESTGYRCVVLPEFLDRAIELHTEYLCTPTFPDDSVEVAIELAQQEITALQDDPQGLCDKLFSAQVFGPLLGRHALGEPETLERITRDDVAAHWKNHYHTGRMIVTAAGGFDAKKLIDLLEKRFAGFGSAAPAGRNGYRVAFEPRQTHHPKDLAQEHVAIAFPGVSVEDASFPVQRVLIAILSGGMSSRLFTEVREKQGLVYWVAAWSETPRGSGVLFLGASTTPERCDKTFDTLLREVDRVSEDLTDDEVERSISGLVAKMRTQGDLTRSRCSELADDLFHHRRPIPPEEKIARIEAVTTERIRQFLADHPRDRLNVLTLGPRVLERAAAVGR
ncbi:MAG: insulinase family protein [Phycisphaerales bacterium]|nr:insulinase family protein [Phycisphaerales bacterium]